MSDLIVTRELGTSGLRRWQRAALAVAVPAFALLWVGGVVSYWRGTARAEDVWLASVFLALAGLLVLLGARTARGALALAGLALFGFAVEIVGSNTGFPFGAYGYTDALRPRVFGAPLVIGVAWMVLAAQSWSLVAPLRLTRPLAVLVAAVLTTAVDFVIDPLAAGPLGYWRWERAGVYYGIPATNFAGWLLTSLAALRLFSPRIEPSFCARAVGFAITLFFALAALALGLALAAAVGFALCAVQLFLTACARRIGGTPTPDVPPNRI
jgi:bisanhydrobacterioruberin hydratase